MGTRKKYEMLYKKNTHVYPQASQWWNWRIILWKRLWSWPYLWIRIENKGENMKFPLKFCGRVGHKTFKLNHCYWHLYHKKLSKHFFTWLMIFFNIYKTFITRKIAPKEVLNLLSWWKTSILFMGHMWRLQVRWYYFWTIIRNFSIFFSLRRGFDREPTHPLFSVDFFF